jgi:phage protein D
VASTTQSVPAQGLPTDYYAPEYRVLVNGEALHPDTKGDVLEVKVVMDIDNLTSFELTINNWDDELIDFKYSNGYLFGLGVGVEVLMGYAGRVVSMVKGQISSWSPQFPASGSPTLSVSGMDAMFLLKNRKPLPGDQKIFVNMADEEIAQVIATRNQLRLKTVPPTQKHDQVVQKNQDDGQFLMERAKRIDYDCFIAVDPTSRLATLNFAPPTDSRAAQQATYYEFNWGTSLISFSPRLSLSDQVSQVTVRGWDPRTKRPIVAVATAADLPTGGTGTSGPEASGASFPKKQDVVVDSPVTSAEEARALAVSLLRERAYKFITGSGQVIGVPDLRPGDNIALTGLGKRFSNNYYVLKVEHTIGSSGYLTGFEARAPYDGGQASP